MNFVIVVSDTLRRDHLGCYGNEWISTPHIDEFASENLAFDKAYSASFPTVPHRRDLMTGRFTSSYTPWAPLAKDEVVLAQVLGDAGYTTMMITDCPHLIKDGFNYDRGFDGWEWIRGQEGDRLRTQPELPQIKCDPTKMRMAERLRRCHKRNVAERRFESDYFAARTMTTACKWLEQNYKHEKFFLYVDTFDPHEPWDAPQWYVDMYDPGYTGEVIDYPRYWFSDYLSPEELKHTRAMYAAEVTMVDRWVGRLFQKIKDLGLMDDTMVLFTTDHGFLHGEHGIIGKALINPQTLTNIPLYEEINHIPLIIHLPGRKSGRTNAVTQPIDFMPTVLDLAQVKIPETVHGKSFASVLSGTADKFRRFAVSAPYLKAARAPVTVVQDNWSAILYPADEEQPAAPDKAVDGYEKTQIPTEQAVDMLFDMSDSPTQEKSVAEDHPDVIAELRQKMIGFFEEVGTDEDIIKRW